MKNVLVYENNEITYRRSYIHKWLWKPASSSSEFLNGFCSFRDSMLGKFTWKEKFDGRLDFAAWKSSFSVVSNQLARFPGKSVKSVINKWVHDVHGFLADSDFWVNLLQHFVNVKRKCLNSSLMSFMTWSSSSTDGFGCFSGHFTFNT